LFNSIPLMARWRRKSVAGFTLLEVIVAFTILSVAMVALLQAFATGMQGLSAAKASATALMHARSKLDEIGQTIFLESGETTGEFDDGFAWAVRIAHIPIELEGDAGGLIVAPFEVEVRVTGPSGGNVTLTTLRLGAPE
jgi:general secretion pathway protein I